MSNLDIITILDKKNGRGVDITVRDGKIVHAERLEPSDWGDYDG
jgi:acetylglutamate kinase